MILPGVYYHQDCFEWKDGGEAGAGEEESSMGKSDQGMPGPDYFCTWIRFNSRADELRESDVLVLNLCVESDTRPLLTARGPTQRVTLEASFHQASWAGLETCVPVKRVTAHSSVVH
jgi:hypothetical protein